MDNKKLPKVPFYKVVLKTNQILSNPLPFHRENFAKFGDSFMVDLPRKGDVIFTRDAAFVQYMLQKNHRNYGKSRLQTEELAKYLGKGLLTINKEHWLRQRRLIQPAFHKKKIEGLLDIINKTIEEQLTNIAVEQEIEAWPLMGDLAFNVVARSLFSYYDKDGKIASIKRITDSNQEMLVKELRQPFKKWWFHLKGDFKRANKNTNEVRSILEQMIETRRASETEYDDLLDMLIKAEYEDGGHMSNDQLTDEILVLFTAGHETTANALSFALLLLAKHPDIQERVLAEINALESGLDHMEKIKQLPFIKQCLEETMRLYPPAYFTDRINFEADEFNDLKIRKESEILISFYEIHRAPEFWDEPEEFNPDRFHPENKKNNSGHYFPFGAGPRLCIGNGFAIYEMVLVLKAIIEKYEISTSLQSIEIKPMITLKPEQSTLLFKKRD
ncbi:cytochrome P450 [Spongiivirga citrea]|uniref:Cytochrome P450 n=1 Tax=Spongiivirga citrea TaxID=1481457 RepID=A0A6M0CQ03_9FLAO|nr:cytochrome P450 [Spongiivirga citrea]NER18114.1 cytochrome P450 [Spongiivirga citrea]